MTNQSNPAVAHQMISRKLGNDVRVIKEQIKSIETIMEAMEMTVAQTFDMVSDLANGKGD